MVKPSRSADRRDAPAHHPQEPDPSRPPSRSMAANLAEDVAHQEEREPDRRDLDREADGPPDRVPEHPRAPLAQARPPDLPRPADDTGRQTGRQDQEAQVREADLPASAAPHRSLRSHRAVHPHPLPGRLGSSSDKRSKAVRPGQGGPSPRRLSHWIEAGRAAVPSGPWRRRGNIGPSRMLPIPRQVRSRSEATTRDKDASAEFLHRDDWHRMSSRTVASRRSG